MKRLSLFAVALALAAAGCSSSSTTPSTTTPTKPTFTANLSTQNEVPPITNAEAGGRGDATITIDQTAGSVTFVVNLNGFPAGTPINIAHIHEAPAGTNGIDEPPGMTASRLSQPPRTPPAWVSISSRNGMPIALK